METAITSLISVIVGLFIGSYLPSYMKKKGENLATKEDIADLVSQTGQLAQATKEIESKIEDQIWNKQRQWKLKRNSVFAAVEAMSRAEDRLVEVVSAYDLAKKQGVELWQSQMTQANKSWSDQMNDFDEKRFGAELVCGSTLVNAMRETAILMRQLNKKTRKFELEDDNYGLVSKPVQIAIRKVIALAREELGIAEPQRDLLS